MAIHYRENQYAGINAHLHSYLQSEPAGWEEFHGMHISHLAETLDLLLPDGYLVRPEKQRESRKVGAFRSWLLESAARMQAEHRRPADGARGQMSSSVG